MGAAHVDSISPRRIPHSEMGWLGKGTAHALQVAWPEMPLAGGAVE